MSTTVSVNVGTAPQFPLSYASILESTGFYEPQGRPDVTLWVTQPNKSTGERAVIRFSNDGKNISYPAHGWSGYSFRRVSGEVVINNS